MGNTIGGVWKIRLALICALFLAGLLALPGCAVFDGLDGNSGGSGGGGGDATLSDASDTWNPSDASSPSDVLDTSPGDSDSSGPDAVSDADSTDADSPDADSPDADVTHDPLEGVTLEFVTQPPSSAQAGEVITPHVSVALKRDGAVFTEVSLSVTLTLDGGAPNAEFEGASATTVDGVATFDQLRINTAGEGYTLIADADGVQEQSEASQAFAVLPGSLSTQTSSLTADPANARANGSDPIRLELELLDAYGNPVPNADVEFESTNSADQFRDAQGGGARAVQTNEQGRYTMELLSSEAGTRTVRVHVDAIQLELDVRFIAGDISRMEIEGQIPNVTAGDGVSFDVLFKDTTGNIVDTDAEVSLQLVDATSGAGLTGTLTVAAVHGRASFDDVLVTLAGNDRSIRAVFGGLNAETNKFNVSPAAPKNWSASIGPSSVKVGSSTGVEISTGVVRDDYDNVVSAAPITVSVTGASNVLESLEGTGSPSGSTFTGATGSDGKFKVRLTSTKAEQKSVTLQVGTSSVLKATITVHFTPESLAEIVVLTQPSNTSAGAPLSSAAFQLRDTYQNALGAGIEVQVELTGASGGQFLSQSFTVGRSHNLDSDTQGRITLNELSVDKVGTYQLKASVNERNATTANFNVTPGAFSASKSKIEVSPASGIVADGSEQAGLTLTILDEFDNPIPGVQVGLDVAEHPIGSGTMGVSTGFAADTTDHDGKATGWVKATQRAGTVELNGKANVAGWKTTTDSASVGFVEPMLQISAQVDYLPADFDVKLQLGNSTSDSIDTTTPVLLGSQPRHSSYTVKAAGGTRVLCKVQSGQGTLTAPVTLQVECADRWLKVSSSKSVPFTAAIRKDGTLWLWGDNSFRQVDNNSSGLSKPRPIRLGTKVDWIDVSAGGGHVLALDSDKKLVAWGRNDNRQASNSALNPQRPPAVIALPASPTNNPSGSWPKIAAGGDFSLAATYDKAYIWGANLSGQTPDPIQEPTRVVLIVCPDRNQNRNCRDAERVDRLSAGVQHFMIVGRMPALDAYPPAIAARDASDGIAWRFFVNGIGQLGLNDNDPRPNSHNLHKPTYNYDNTWLQMEAGDTSSAGITLPDGRLWVWGERWGQFTSYSSYEPVRVGNETGWKQVSVGPNHYLAINANDQLFGWGKDVLGELGAPANPDVPDPVLQTLPDTTVSDVSAGVNVTFYIDKESGRLYGRGSNASGNLGVAKTEAQLPSSQTFQEVKTNPTP